jgi:phosphoribosylformimino-5-aminoimidazole carboxamide ribotide isomerase
MKLLPAIDLLDGRAVRLEAGDRARATVFHERPVELVAELARGGADRLHVVDLDGAFGEPRQAGLVREIVRASPIPVEVGGGLRDLATIEAVLALGVAFVVLGTAAVRDPALVEGACRAHPGRVIVAVDAKDGVVAVDGWTASGGVTAIELGRRAAGWGAAALLYTDVARDGLRAGPNVAATAALAAAAGCEVIASGGVGSLDDLAALRDAGIPAVVVGRALYDRRFTVEEAARVAHATAGLAGEPGMAAAAGEGAPR